LTAVSLPKFTASGEIVWKPVRDLTDPAGQRHVFVRQYLRRPSGDVELFGSEIGLHYSKTGKFLMAGGQQFEDASVTNSVSIAASDAHRSAIGQLRKAGAPFQAKPYESLETGVRNYLDSHAALLLIPVSTNTFRYAYRVTVESSTEDAYSVIIDADTQQILSATEIALGSNCGPSASSQVGATSTPIRGSTIRYSGANAYTRGVFPFEAHYEITSAKSINIYQQVPKTDNLACIPNTDDQTYTLVPLQESSLFSGWAHYGDYSQYKGTVAGDALYRTLQTYNVLSGYSNALGLTMNVVIESTHVHPGCMDACATYYMNTVPFAWAPPGDAVLIFRTPATSPLYNSAAALDQIAHEWGHKFVQNSTGISTETVIGHELHEGFADVIGQIVEKAAEPAGTGLETSSDWDLGEEMALTTPGQYAFSGNRDDGSDGHDFGNYHLNNNFYSTDNGTDLHDIANIMNVAYYVMSQGGPNPSCGRLGNCSVYNPVGLGAGAAGDLFLRALTYYVPSCADWEHLGSYLEWAAFDVYNNCPGGPGDVAQTAVQRGFEVVGYPTIGQRECQ